MSVSSVTQSGWRNVKLREVIARAQGGFASGERSQDGVIQLRMNNVTTRGGFDWSSYIRVPADPQTVAEYQLQSGDVLFNNTNSTELVGKSVYFEKADEPIVFSNHFTRLRTRTDILDPRFLAYWLQSAWQRGLFAEICNRWIGQSAVQRDKLLELPIALPSIGEQKRISAILNEQIAAVEKARAAAEKQISEASSLCRRYLLRVFGELVKSAPKTCSLETVAQLLPSKSISTAGETTVETVTTACLTEAGFDLRGIKTARMAAKDVSDCILNSGEVLVARSNTPELVGRAAVFPGHDKPIVASDLTIRIKTRPELLPEFLAGYLSFLYVSKYWVERAGGASGTMKKITRTQIVELPIPVPVLGVQQRIASQLSKATSAAQQVETMVSGVLDEIDRLPAAFLRRAFSGQL